MAEQIGFRRNMGLFMAVMIGIGATMGPGIFALPGELAHMIGPLGVLVYLAMGFLTLFTALNYSELSAAIPLAGGGYSFTHRTLNRPVAFFTGWFFWIGNTLACSMYALIFALTIRAYFIPEASIALLTLLTTVVFTAVNFMGMKEAIIVITVMNLVELAVLVGVAALGFTDIEPRHLEPLAPMGWGPFIPAMALIYISYVGFELISNAAEEIIQPGKNIPRAILITLGISTAIYVFVVGVMMGTVNYIELAESDIPFIFTAERLFGAWGRWAGVIATIMASLSAFSVTLGASARILYALGRDRHFPYFFSKLHPKFQTPHIALFICALIVIIFSSSGIVKFVASLSDFGYLMGLGIINYAVIPLHKKMPNLRRPFQTRFFPWIPILGVITTWMFVPALEFRSFVLGGFLTLVGSAIYLFNSDNRAEVSKLGKFYVKSLKLFIYNLS
jgi:amino acid transporter